MTDQAQSLRQLVSSQQSGNSVKPTSPRTAKIITVSSGKGGVGKSNFTLNFALTLQSMGKRYWCLMPTSGWQTLTFLWA